MIFSNSKPVLTNPLNISFQFFISIFKKFYLLFFCYIANCISVFYHEIVS